MIQSVGVSPSFIRIGKEQSYINTSSIIGIYRKGKIHGQPQLYAVTYIKNDEISGKQKFITNDITEDQFKQLNVIA